MKKLRLSLVLFFAMLIYIFFSIRCINNISDNINSLCRDIETNIMNNEVDKAYHISCELLELWDKNSKLMILYVNTNELDTINNKIVELTQLTRFDCKESAVVATHVITHLINEIKSLEIISLHNIF